MIAPRKLTTCQTERELEVYFQGLRAGIRMNAQFVCDEFFVGTRSLKDVLEESYVQEAEAILKFEREGEWCPELCD